MTAGTMTPRQLPPLQPLSFTLPPALEAPSPPEARGMTRDSVRMMVAHRSDRSLVHSHFSELPRFLDEDDLVVLNTSGTLAAEVDGSGQTVSPCRSTSRRNCPPGCGPSRSAGMDAPFWKPPPGHRRPARRRTGVLS